MTMRSRQIFMTVLVAVTIIAFFDITGGGLIDMSLRFAKGSVEFEKSGKQLSIYPDAKVADTFTVAEKINELTIADNRGVINITGADTDKVSVSYEIAVFADSEERAQNFIEQCRIDTDINNGRLNLALVNESEKMIRNIRELDVNYDIQVPRATALNITNEFGKVGITDIDGSVSVNNEFDPIEIKNVNGTVDVNMGHDNVDISDIGKSVIINVEHGSVNGTRINGDLDLTSSFSDIDLRDINGSLKIESRHDDNVAFENVSGDVRLDTEFSSVSGYAVAGSIYDVSRFGSVRLDNISSTTDVRTEHSDVVIGLLDTKAASGYDIDLRAEESGSIRSDISLDTNETNNITTAKGVYGKGKVPIAVKTKYGDISIRLRKQVAIGTGSFEFDTDK